MKVLIYGLIILLAVLHQDFWWWNDGTLVFGFMPIGLAYHAGVSMAAALLWAMAVKYCWPKEADEADALPEPTAEGGHS